MLSPMAAATLSVLYCACACVLLCSPCDLILLSSKGPLVYGKLIILHWPKVSLIMSLWSRILSETRVLSEPHIWPVSLNLYNNLISLQGLINDSIYLSEPGCIYDNHGHSGQHGFSLHCILHSHYVIRMSFCLIAYCTPPFSTLISFSLFVSCCLWSIFGTCTNHHGWFHLF